MKKILLITIISVSLMLVGSSLFAQVFEIKAIENDMGYLEVQMRETSGTGTPTTATPIAQISFEIRWSNTSTADVEVLCATNQYTIADGLTAKQTKDSYFWRNFVKTQASPVYTATNWVQNEWETIATFKVTGTTGVVDFDIAPVDWVPQNLVWVQGDPATPYPVTPNGTASNYSYPTLVYDLVWTGNGTDTGFQNEHSWNLGDNWSDECGGGGSVPNASNNCYIPAGLTNYPENINKAFATGAGAANNIRVENGGLISFGTQGNPGETLTVSESLLIYGTFTVNPDAGVTVTGSTYLDAATSLIIAADADGIGSFIDNGTITYGTSGTAKVQTYLTGSGTPGTYDFHCVGPTVDITGSGVTLDAFNVVPGETYAYKYDEPTDDWENYYTLGDPVPTAKGIGLSTNDGSTNTMEMTGSLKTGAISSEAMTIDLNGTYLLSNPYPSSIYWNDLNSNNSNVNDKVYVYDGTNYQSYNTSSGGTGTFNGYIQVGQGFFVEATAASAFTFDNGDRHHSSEPFYKSGDFTNRLDVRVSGNESTDGLLVHFYDGATSGYEANEDIQKKMSYNETATQFWTVLEDGQHMSINAMPLDLLGKGMQSIPMSFICSATTEYTMNFLDTETFEIGTEIWLEDKQTGAEWISINDNPDYTFTATPDDLEDRFVLHFFGPTGVSEFEIENTVDIFSYRQNAFVRNNTNEVIKSVNIYTLAGKLLQSNHPDDIKLSRYWVSENMGYYVVRVITDENVYTNKVLITK